MKTSYETSFTHTHTLSESIKYNSMTNCANVNFCFHSSPIRIAAANKLYRLILRLQSFSCLKMFQEDVGIHAA